MIGIVCCVYLASFLGTRELQDAAALETVYGQSIQVKNTCLSLCFVSFVHLICVIRYVFYDKILAW